MFVVIEGIDGSGKSTLVENLTKSLRTDMEIGINGINVEKTREPYFQEYRKMIIDSKNNLETMMLFMADRAKHVENILNDYCNSQDIIICDRYFYSNVAYQSVIENSNNSYKIDTTMMERIIKMNSELYPIPDVVIYIDIPVKTALSRVNNRNDSENMDKFEKLGYLQHVKEIYDQMMYKPDVYFRKTHYNTQFLIIRSEYNEDELCKVVKTFIKNNIKKFL